MLRRLVQYLVLTCGDARFVTHTVPKSLNPEWNVIEEFPISSYQHLLIDITCWDKDRFGKDYLGEFDLALEDIFANQKTAQEPKWYPLKSKRPGKKTGVVSGEVQLQFTLFDPANKAATPHQVLERLNALLASYPVGNSNSREPTPSRTPVLAPTSEPRPAAPGPELSSSRSGSTDDDEDVELDDDSSSDVEDNSKPENIEKQRRRMRIKGLKSRRHKNPYAFTNGDSDVVGIIFLEINRITDLPPESNLTRTSFDMDPFVVVSLGKKTYRTKRVRHNLNPVYNEKMLFQVQGHEQAYSFSFTVIDHDKYSGNDFVASCSLPIQDIIEKAPKANPENGLYDLREPAEFVPPQASKSGRFKRLGLSRSPSAQSLSKMMRPGLSKNASNASGITQVSSGPDPSGSLGNDGLLVPPPDGLATPSNEGVPAAYEPVDDDDFNEYAVPLTLKNLDKWEAKHSPVVYLRAKYLPYPALRQQFWRALLKQYDTDESGRISRVEMTTMLDSLGSTLRESTIDSFFARFPHKAADNEETWDLTMDEAVICLEDQLQAKSKQTISDKLKSLVPDMKNLTIPLGKPNDSASASASGYSTPQLSPSDPGPPASSLPVVKTPGEESDFGERDDLQDDSAEEHVVEIRECPICHQPRLNKRSDADIITHIATCASQDWRQVNHVLMSGFVTASQAQRKWYSKVITKISYGGYKLGANSANILVQDRLTGQINEEKMSVYVRLGIRMLYKGLKSRDMENKRSKWILFHGYMMLLPFFFTLLTLRPSSPENAQEP
jgi:phosphatidylserine decarboxylase